ncbi:hypothetical protein EV421DRAFT_1912880 [Armillaria borealis]|uniref:Uncharacterized protein n=1 Tax=Armillaria borealis TaxID=47425 RepID=A0AA39ME68_9AGAR|nr:hypothetical protein EV421DRAFT_1912880 [Armillaria borealis]
MAELEDERELRCSDPTLPKVRTPGIPVRTPTCGTEEEHNDDIKAMWLGNTCFLVELPFIASLWRGMRVSFDPVFTFSA